MLKLLTELLGSRYPGSTARLWRITRSVESGDKAGSWLCFRKAMQKHSCWRWALLAGAAWVVWCLFSFWDLPWAVLSKSGGSGKGYVANKGEELVSGTGDSSRTDLCPRGCIPCSDSNLRGWLSLDSSGEGNRGRAPFLSSGERAEQLTDGAFWWNAS